MSLERKELTLLAQRAGYVEHDNKQYYVELCKKTDQHGNSYLFLHTFAVEYRLVDPKDFPGLGKSILDQLPLDD